MAQHNADRVADWNGQSGERWIAHQARLDARLAVFGQVAIEAAAPAAGERVLDVGCGAGASSLALAARVGAGGQVLGVDISEPLIARARALAPQDTPALFRVADASSAELPEGAHPFPASVRRREADVVLRPVDAGEENLIGRRIGRLGTGFYASRDYAA
ncbi:methyltransferase domain-containing protein, partial [Bradyrhizobium macuxiense]|uniref:methyltransferase domain-containing protein n=1 Tax=Bradyrhizobium macuxiense TaxID=1755647 RepID=UPI001FD975D5